MSCGTSGGATTLCSVPLALLPLGSLGGTTASRLGSQLFVCQQTLLCLKKLGLHPLDLNRQSSHWNGLFSPRVLGSRFLSVFFLGSWVPLPRCFVFLGSWVPFPGCFLLSSLYFNCSFVSAVANELRTRAPFSVVLTCTVFSRGLCRLFTLFSLASFLPLPFVVTSPNQRILELLLSRCSSGLFHL